MRNKKNAFTLIELLVVIAIIAILAAILFPVFAQAREKARATACTSNEKQLGLGFIQYAQDYDECFPVSWNGSCCDNRPNGTGWASQLYPYVKSTGVYACPDDPTVPAPNIVSYSYNANIGGGNLSSAGYGMSYGCGGNQSKLIAPTKTVLLCEVTGDTTDVTNPTVDSPATTGSSNVTIGRSSVTWGANLLGQADYGNGAGAPVASVLLVTGPLNGAGTFTKPAVHGGQTGSNYLMADGHVKFLNGSKVSPGRTYYLGGSTTAESYGQAYTNNADGTSAGTSVATFSVL